MLNLLFASNALGPWIPMELCWKPDPAILDAKCCSFFPWSGPSFNAFNSCFCGPWPLQLFLRRAVGGHGRRLLRTASFWRPSSLVISVWGSGRIGFFQMFEGLFEGFWIVNFLFGKVWIWKAGAPQITPQERCSPPRAIAAARRPRMCRELAFPYAHNVTYALVSW